MTDKKDDVRMEPIPPEQRIPVLKQKLRAAITDWRLAASDGNNPFPGGHNMQAYLMPGFAEKSRRVNALVAELKQLDPAFTVDWTPLPEGK